MAIRYLDQPTSSKFRYVDEEPEKPSILDQLLNQRPSPIAPTYRELPRVGADIIDTALFGLVPDRLKEKLPPVTSMRGKATDVVGQGLALFYGGPAKAGQLAERGLAKFVPGLAKRAVGRVAASGVSNAVMGGVSDLEHPEQIPGRAAAGGVLGTVGGAVGEGVKAGVSAWKGLEAIGRPSTIPKPNALRTNLFEKVRQRLLRAPNAASDEFGQQLEVLAKQHPGTFVDASAEVAQVQDLARRNPAFQTLLETSIRQTPLKPMERAIVQNVLRDPAAAAQLGLEQTQMLKRVLQQGLKQKFQQVNPEYLGAHLDMLDVWHTLRAKELASFEGFEKVAQPYAEAMSNFRLIKTALKEGNIEEALLSNFQNKGKVIEAFRYLASPDTLKLVTRLQQATNRYAGLNKLLGVAGKTALGAVGLGAVAGAGKGIYDLVGGQ